MKKIKIVNIISKLVYGGTETVLLNYYSKINKDNFEYYIITMEASNQNAIKRMEKIGFKVFIVGDWEKQPIIVGKKICDILSKYKFDIIHSHLSHTNFYFMILGKICGIKVRISHSHLTSTDVTVKDKLKHNIYKKLIRFFGTHFMACSEAAAKDLYGNYNNVYILKNAIDVNKFVYNEEIRTKYRTELKIKKEDILICNIGRMCEQKNQIFLIDIMNNIIRKNNKYKLLIIGEGELENKIKEKIDEYNIQDNIIILSKREDINCLLQAADIFILPSLYEGLGIVLIEAQSAGLPSVASKDVIPIEAKVTGLVNFIDLNKGDLYWSNYLLRIRLKKRKNYTEEITKQGYNIEIEAKRLENYYLNILNKKGILK